MENDSKNSDVVLVEEDSNPAGEAAKEESSPIMQLLQRLTSSDNKGNTILTNAQIFSILQKDYKIDTRMLHELEVDIYLNVVKKFLKDWPLWDEFDQEISRMRKEKAYSSINKTLDEKYKDLKEYLKEKIELTKPCAKEAVTSMHKERFKELDKIDTSDIVFEINCSRKELNKLIFTCPNPLYKNSIFNVVEESHTKITSSSAPPIEAIVNWLGVKVSIDVKFFSYSREMLLSQSLKHVLVNKHLGPRNLKRVLNQHIQIKEHNPSLTEINKKKIYKIFDAILMQHTNNIEMYHLLQTIFIVLRSDLEAIMGETIVVPGWFRQHTSRYPYYRKLCKEVKMPVPLDNNYDLYIEETLTPMHVYNIGKVGKLQSLLLPVQFTWLKIECGQCNAKFTGEDFHTNLQEHFRENHDNESDWTCTNCEKSYSMRYLTINKWQHACLPS